MQHNDLPRRHDSASSWSPFMDDALRLTGLAVISLVVVFADGPLLAQSTLDPLAPRIGLVLLVVTHLVCIASLWARSWRWRRAVLLTFCLVLAEVLMLPQRGSIDPSDYWAPGMWALPVELVILLTVSRQRARRWLLAGFLVLVAIELVSPLVGDFSWTRWRALDSLSLVQTPLCLFLDMDGLMAMAATRDAYAARAQQARQDLVADHSLEIGRREAARILHDHVLHALHAVGLDRRLVSAQEAAQECRTAVGHVTRSTSSEDGTASLAALVHQDPLVAELGTEVIGDADGVPAPVAETLAAAVHEAISNIRRHARADHSSVRISPHRHHGCWVEISDDGVGFSPERRTRRLGLRHSILGRIEEIGGHAEVVSSPGQGTTVILRWPASEQDRDHALATVASEQQANRIMAWASVPTFLVTALIAVAVVPTTPDPWLGTVVALAVAALAIWNLVRLRTRPMPFSAAAVLAGVAIVGWFVTLPQVPTQGGQLYLPWMAWGAGGLAHLIMVCRPLREALVALVTAYACLLGGLTWHVGLHQTTHTYLSTVMTGAGPPTVVLVAVLATRGLARQAQEHAAAQAGAQAASARMRQFSQLERFWSARVTDETLPLMRGVAEGTIDADSAEVQARAKALEVAVRDELVLGPAHSDLVEDLSRLRKAGWAVTSTLSQDDPEQALRTASVLLQMVGRPATMGQPITISTTNRAATAVALSAEPEQMERWERRITSLGGRMDIDPEFTRLEVPCHD